MDQAQPERRELRWEDLASPDWFPRGAQGPLWLSAFNIMSVTPLQFADGPILLDLHNSRALILYGQLPYVRITDIEISSMDVPQFVSRVDEVQAPEGAYLLIVVPFDNANPLESEALCRERVDLIAGLLMAIFGPNIAYRKVFDNLVTPQTNQRTAFSHSIRVPSTMPSPDLSSQRLELANQAYESIDSLQPNEANRIRLSLRWFYESHQASGVGIFLKLWFAIETLGMSDNENIRPITESLARSYGITPQEVRRVFSVGQLYGFRNRIVHRGLLPPIHALLSDYVSALYLDILFERLGLPSGHFAECVQSDPSFDLQSFIA